MPNITPLVMQNYTDDLGRSYENVKFKIKTEYSSGPTATLFGYRLPENQVCATARFFAPRYLLASFSVNGRPEKIKFPVPRTEQIEPGLRALKQIRAVCVDLVGEKWSLIPPSLGYTPSNPTYTLPQDSSKTSGTFRYQSDVLGSNLRAKFAVEIAPDALSTQILNAFCMPDIQENDICAATFEGFQTRRFVATAKNENGGSIVRQAPLTSLAGVPTCLGQIGARASCVGYLGESVKNLQDYFPDL